MCSLQPGIARLTSANHPASLKAEASGQGRGIPRKEGEKEGRR